MSDDRASRGREHSGDSRAALSRRSALRVAGAAVGVSGTTALAGCSSPLSSFDGVSPDWRAELGGSDVSGAPALAGGRLLVGAGDKVLYSLDTESGDASGLVKTGGYVEDRPVLPEESADGSPPEFCHVHSTDGDVYGVPVSDESGGDSGWVAEDVPVRGELGRAGPLLVEMADALDSEHSVATGYAAETGERLFQRPSAAYRPNALTSEQIVFPVPAGTVGDGAGTEKTETTETTLSSGDDDREQLVAVDTADGSVRWATEPTPQYPEVRADEDLVVVERAGENRQIVVGRDPSDGSRRWRTTIQGAEGLYGPKLLASNFYFVLDDDPATVVAVGRDGEEAWRRDAGLDVLRFASDGETLYVASRVQREEGGIRTHVDAFSADGTRQWTTTPDLAQPEALTVVGNTVVVHDGREVAALDAANGETHWRYEDESYSRVRVAVSETAVFASFLDRGAVVRLPL